MELKLDIDIYQAQQLIKQVKDLAGKQLNQAVEKAAFETRQKSQKRLVSRMEQVSTNTAQSVYYKVNKRKGEPWWGVVRINQKKWAKWIKWSADGGVKTAGMNIRSETIGIPLPDYQTFGRRKLYKTVSWFAFDDKIPQRRFSKRVKFKMLPIKNSRTKLVVQEKLRRGKRHTFSVGFGRQTVTYPQRVIPFEDLMLIYGRRELQRAIDRDFDPTRRQAGRGRRWR